MRSVTCAQPPRNPRGDRDLAELKLVRDALVNDRKGIGNRGKHLRHPLAKRLNKERLAQIKGQLKKVDAEIRKLIGEREDLQRRFEILTSIPCVADITAAGLITHMPELGTMTGPQAASLAGLAPVTRESGAWKGRSFIQGGRQEVRRLLYMPAVAAIRYNPTLGAKYIALRDAGKPPKVAITAVMRKLIILANALVLQDRLLDPGTGQGLLTCVLPLFSSPATLQIHAGQGPAPCNMDTPSVVSQR